MELKLLCIKEPSGETANSPEAILKLMRAESLADRECFWILHLNTKHKVIEKELVAMGCSNAAVITPREVFRKAIIAGATTIITVHNHPSGDLRPSPNDEEIWNILVKAGELIGVKVLDNIIIAQKGYYSSAEEGKLYI